MVEQKLITKKLENDDLDVINKNIIFFSNILLEINEHLGRLDFDTRQIKEYLINKEKGEIDEKD